MGASQTFAGSGIGDAPVLECGSRVGRYAVLGRLGAGAMGVVYAAVDEDLQRRVALKMARIGDSPDLEKRLLREAQSLARVSHDHVIRVYEAGTCDEHVFVAMQHVDGVNLGTWLGASPDELRGWREVVDMFTRVGCALAAVHEVGLVHRDFKPDNVMVSRDGRPYLTDFGLACGVGDQDGLSECSGAALEITGTGQVAGTPAYMAPEQFLGAPASAAMDQFAFCVALYRGLFGVAPFAGRTTAELLDNVTAGRLRGVHGGRGVPPELVRVVLRGLARPPGTRWPSVMALVEALGAATTVAAPAATSG